MKNVLTNNENSITFSMYAHEDLVKLIEEDNKFLIRISKLVYNSQMSDEQFELFMVLVKKRIEQLNYVVQGYKPRTTSEVWEHVQNTVKHEYGGVYPSITPKEKPNISIEI